MGEIMTTNEKKKSQLRFNVGGGVVLGGVVLLGGGLAVAGLMAAFSIIKNRNFGKHYHKNQNSTTATPSDKIHDGSPGLSSVLQNPSTAVHQNSWLASFDRYIIIFEFLFFHGIMVVFAVVQAMGHQQLI